MAVIETDDVACAGSSSCERAGKISKGAAKASNAWNSFWELDGRRAGSGVLESFAGFAQQAGVPQFLELQPERQQPDFTTRAGVLAETVKRFWPARIIPSQNTTTIFTARDLMALAWSLPSAVPYRPWQIPG